MQTSGQQDRSIDNGCECLQVAVSGSGPGETSQSKYDSEPRQQQEARSRIEASSLSWETRFSQSDRKVGKSKTVRFDFTCLDWLSNEAFRLYTPWPAQPHSTLSFRNNARQLTPLLRAIC
jgi:hypothetical protein